MLLLATDEEEVGGAKAEEEVADWMLVATGDIAFSVMAEAWQIRPSVESLVAGALLLSLNTWLRLFALELTRDESATRDDGPGSLDCMSVCAAET